MNEIERKFLVTKPLHEILFGRVSARKRIEQRYLGGKSGDWSIRVRRVYHVQNEYFLTMKRKVSARRRIELETRIDQAFYDEMAAQCGAPLRKTRYCLPYGDHMWELDLFDDFKGLMIAEIELQDENEDFIRPSWLGDEITDDKRYKNHQLAKKLDKRLNK